MTDPPENAGSGEAEEPARARSVPRATPRKPGSGQHRKKIEVGPTAAETAAARAEAAAQRRARAEAAAERARAAEERRQRHQRNLLATWVSIGLVVVIVGVFVGIKVVKKPKPVGGSGISAASPAVVSQITNVAKSVLDRVGDGGVAVPFLLPNGNPPALTDTATDLPRVLYVGALYCPFCATERWPMAVALSRFGSFTGLHFLISADTGETIKNIHTLDFTGVTYTSTALSFTPVETETRSHKPLESLSSSDNALFDTYDAPPTLPQGSNSTTIPFMDIGNQWVLSGASYDATQLEGLTWQQIAAAAASGRGVGQNLDGTANWLTAAFCGITGNKPAPVCEDPVIQGLVKRLPRP
ncbi:MAG TPA: DUF929 family protein [Actinomycetota bacterium]|nr:DUF929 family protein [Actinomycetota bacterium]